MAQAHMTDVEIDRDKHGLCLLSLDGDGIRGLSTLYILQKLMKSINSVRQENGLSTVKPCEVFDLIGGTSSGGLIAIMLGRLEMDVDTCIQRYISFMGDVFGHLGGRMFWRLRSNYSFSSNDLEAAIKHHVLPHEDSEKELLNDDRPESRRCRAFVCALRKANKSIARLRTYPCDTIRAEETATIWQAAQATFATSSLFDPIRIGEGYHEQEYVDEALRGNNPVNEVWAEAQDIWMPNQGRLESIVKCIVSIGAGNLTTLAVKGNQSTDLKILKDIATQTEAAELVFAINHRDLQAEQRHFRFNLEQGLRSVILKEYQDPSEVLDATTYYLNGVPIRNQIQDCAVNLSHKKFWDGEKSDYLKLITPSSVSLSDQFRVPFYPSDTREAVYFVGREKILSLMEQKLLPPTSPLCKIVVLLGLGGVGKTQTAIHFARQHQQAYNAILWFDASDEATLQRSFLEIAEKLPCEAVPQVLLYDSQDLLALDELVQAVKHWLELPGNGHWLLIFDNADSPAYDIQTYFPETRQGSIIVTTRLQGLKIGASIEVSKLSDHEGISILARTSGRVDLGQDPDVGDLIKLLDGHPLALFNAGAYLSHNMIAVAKYLQYYHQVLSVPHLTTPKLSSFEVSLYPTWNISLNLLRQQNKAAVQLLQLWAYFDNQDLWFDLLAARTENVPTWLKTIAQSKSTFLGTIQSLHNSGLINGPNNSGGFGMHSLLHDWILNVLNNNLDHSMISLALSCICSLVPTKLKTDSYALTRRLLPHAERCLKLFMEVQFDDRYQVRTPSSGDSFHVLGTLYHDQGKLKEAETMYQLALNEKEKVLGPDNPSTLHTMDGLGLLYNLQGKLVDAESMFQQALKGFKQKLGPEHPSTLRAMNNLGALYTAQGKGKEAESLLLIVLAGFKNLADSDRIPVLETSNNLGLLYSNQSRLNEAMAMYKRALAGYEEAVGREHPLTLIIVGNLGNLFANQGMLDAAESMDLRALYGLEKTLGPEHRSTLEIVNNLASLYTKKGELHQAESMYLRVMIGKEKALGSEHTSTLNTFNNLANLYSERGELLKAEALYQRALNGYIKALGPEHGSTLSVINNLASLYHQEGKSADAKALYLRALVGEERALGREHPSTLNTISNLAKLYSNTGKLNEAKALYHRALKGKEKGLELEYQSITIRKLANLYGIQGKLNYQRLTSDQQLTSSTFLGGLTGMLVERNDSLALRTSAEWQEVVNSQQEQLDRRSDRWHDMIALTAARSEVLEALQQFSASDSELVEFTLFWDVPNFRSQECSDGQQLGSVLVLSGNEREVQATTCASYADQILPGAGYTVLDTIDSIVAGKSLHASASIDQLEFSLTQEMSLSRSNEVIATIFCHAQKKLILDFTEILLWLCAALRVSSSERPSRSRALLRKDFSGSHPRISIALSDLQPMKAQNGDCWYTLLPRSVIADGFSVPPRKGEKGLEVPLDVMMGLSRISTAFEMGEHYYFMGLTTALVPVKMFGKESIQWHLIRGPQNSTISRQNLPSTSVLSAHEFGPTDIDIKYVLEKISRRRHFVGWCEEAYVRLGTKNATFTTQRTGLHEKSKSIDVQSFGSTAGTSGMGIFSFMGTVTCHISPTRIEPSGEDSRHYELILLQAQRTPYIVYDIETKSAWLVPAICLILHMIHLRIQADQISMVIPFASCDWKSGQAAYKVLKEYRDVAQDNSDPSKPLKLESIVREIWTSLSACKQTPAEKHVKSGQYKLLAYELMDIAMRESWIRLKWTDVCNTGGWPELTGIVERVLVCRGIGEAICRVPKDSVSGWLRVPDNNHLLCATATCLKALSERVGLSPSHLLEDRVWKYSGKYSNPFQKVVSAGKTPARLPAFPDSGAFIFGGNLKNTWSTEPLHRDPHDQASEDGQIGNSTQQSNRADDVAPITGAPLHLAASSKAYSNRRSSFYSIGKNPPIFISSVYIQDGFPRNNTADIQDYGRTDEIRRLRRIKRSSNLHITLQHQAFLGYP